MPDNKKFLICPGALDCNRGDQALAWEAIDLLREVSHNCEIAIMSDSYDDPNDSQSRQTRKRNIAIIPPILFNPRRVASKKKYEVIDSGWSLAKMKLRALADAIQISLLLLLAKNRIWARLLLSKPQYRTYTYLRSCRALVVKGGGYIYSYRGLRWAYYILFGLFPIMLAQRCGIKVIILPNSFGPFETRWSRWLVRLVLGRCELIAAREYKSYDVLNTLIPDKAKLFPDMAFVLKPDKTTWAKKELMGYGIPLGEKKCVGITMRPWRFPNAENPQEKYANYIQTFAKFMEHLLQIGFMPVLFAHTTGPGAHENDTIALKDALHTMFLAEQIPYVDADYNCRQIKSLYSLMDFMVCTRFHSAIFSISQEIPCIAVGYQGYKASGIMGEIGLEKFNFSIDELHHDLLIEAFGNLISCQEEVKKKMKVYMNVCDEKLHTLHGLVASVIGETIK